MFFRHLPLIAAMITSTATAALAGSETGTSITPPVEDPLAKGVTEIELLGGYFHSPINTGGNRPEFDYAGVDLRYGIVLTPTFLDRSFVRGNIEFLTDVLLDGVVKGAGNYLVGGSFLFRYNFLQPGSRIIPYFQLGGGGLESNAANDSSQRLIGSNFEFILDADLGMRIRLDDRWSLHIEGGFQHISNAGTAPRNVGVNALGGRVGLGWTY